MRKMSNINIFILEERGRDQVMLLATQFSFKVQEIYGLSFRYLSTKIHDQTVFF